ncbi:MAG: hypothetical protein AAGJ86_05610, partial [Pseudomonadota bacterium]
MSRHVLFAIHGMGTHDATWANPGMQVLRAAFREYAATSPLAFDDVFEVVPLVYDDRLQAIRQRANSDFAAFKGALLAQHDPATDSVTRDSLQIQLDKYESSLGLAGDEFTFTHLLDVILYRFSNATRMAIDVSVAKQITDRLEQPHLSWSVLAHSLGSSVIHNTLNSLYNTGLRNDAGESVGPLSAVESRCTSLAMIANVSRVLQREDAKVYETAVAPGSALAGRLCGFYLNVRHKLDPFTKPKPFNPDLWPDANTFSRERYQHIRPSHIAFTEDELDRVHAFDHYLLNPRVHVPIFRSILGRDIVGDNEYRTAKSRFDTEIERATIDRVRDRLESRLPGPTGTWRRLLSV